MRAKKPEMVIASLVNPRTNELVSINFVPHGCYFNRYRYRGMSVGMRLLGDIIVDIINDLTPQLQFAGLIEEKDDDEAKSKIAEIICDPTEKIPIANLCYWCSRPDCANRRFDGQINLTNHIETREEKAAILKQMQEITFTSPISAELREQLRSQIRKLLLDFLTPTSTTIN